LLCTTYKGPVIISYGFLPKTLTPTCLRFKPSLGYPEATLKIRHNRSSRYTPCLKKTVQICFCYNFVKFLPIWIIFGRKMAKKLKLYQMDSFSISPNSRHHTTVLNSDVQNCYITLKVVTCNNLSDDFINKTVQFCRRKFTTPK